MNKEKIKNLKKKGFTLIELIVVIAILGILVLIAAPKFLGYTSDAKDVKIKNDIKVYENTVTSKLIRDPEYINSWTPISEEMASSLEGKRIINSKGKIVQYSELEGKELFKIPNSLEVKSNIKENLFSDEDGNVYYFDEEKISEASDEEKEDTKLPETEAAAFTFVENDTVSGAYEGPDGKIGYFSYIGGNRDVIVIPEEIDGFKLTSYANMFASKRVQTKKVVSYNEDIVSTERMFFQASITTNGAGLDLSELDTSNVTNMASMFVRSTAGYYHSLDLSGKFDTSKVEDFNNMFANSTLQEINLSNFDTSSAKDMSSMFYRANSPKITLGPEFTLSEGVNLKSMFASTAISYTDTFELDLSSFDFSKANQTNLSEIFKGMGVSKFYMRSQQDIDLFRTLSNNNPEVLLSSVVDKMQLKQN